MKIIDAHIHIGKWSEIFLNLESTVDEAVTELKKSGVDEAICMPTDRTSNMELLSEIKNRKDYKFYFIPRHSFSSYFCILLIGYHQLKPNILLTSYILQCQKHNI